MNAALAAGFVLFGIVACSSSDDGPGSPAASTPPAGVTFVGGTFGAACTGRVYNVAGTGYAFCNGGVWAYTTSDPSGYQFGKLVVDSDGGVTNPCTAPCSCGACSGQGGQGG